MMTSPRAPKPHDWAFVGSVVGAAGGVAEAPLLVAVCRKCGVIRAQVAEPSRETTIDLAGDCRIA